MLHTRVIPGLLLQNGGLVKTVQFKEARYVGDPINAVRIYNEKEVDEVVFLDIGASRSGTGPDFELLASIASEAFMPFGYGGGIASVEHAQRLYSLGIEKVVVNTVAAEEPSLIQAIADMAGSSGVVGAIDVGRNWRGRCTVFVRGGRQDLKVDPVTRARTLEQLGVGEILLNSVDRDGTMTGYDVDVIHRVSSAVSVPVVAMGGAGCLEHLRDAVEHGASAVAAGSLFVFHGKHKAVLITYPDHQELVDFFANDC